MVKSCAVLNASSGLILIEDDNSNVLNIGADFNIDISALNGIIFNKNKGVIKEINQSRKTLCFKISQDNYFYGTNCVYCLIAPLFLLKIIPLSAEISILKSAPIFKTLELSSSIKINPELAFSTAQDLTNISCNKTFTIMGLTKYSTVFESEEQAVNEI